MLKEEEIEALRSIRNLCLSICKRLYNESISSSTPYIRIKKKNNKLECYICIVIYYKTNEIFKLISKTKDIFECGYNLTKSFLKFLSENNIRTHE